MSSAACGASQAVGRASADVAAEHQQTSASHEDHSSRNVVDLGSLPANTGSLDGLLEDTRQGENGAGLKTRSVACPSPDRDVGKSLVEPDICLQSAGVTRETTACDATCSSVVSIASPRGTGEAQTGLSPPRDEGSRDAHPSAAACTAEPRSCKELVTAESYAASEQALRSPTSQIATAAEGAVLRTMRTDSTDEKDTELTGHHTPEWHNTPEMAHATVGADRQHCTNPAAAMLEGLSPAAMAPSSAHVPVTRLQEGGLTYQGGMMPVPPYNEGLHHEYALYQSAQAGQCPPSGDYIIETVTTCLRGVSTNFTGLFFTQNTSTNYEVTEQLYQASAVQAQSLRQGQNYYHDAAYLQDASARPQVNVVIRPGAGQDLKIFESLLGTDGPRAAEQHLFQHSVHEQHAASRPQQSDEQMSNSQRSTSITDQTGDQDVSTSITTLDGPSRGSAGHNDGICKPCAFLYTKGCDNGFDCPFCHLCEPGEKKKRRKAKMEVRRTTRKWQRPAAPWFCDR